MTNREKYKKAFSEIYPSKESVERMINVTKGKKGRIKYRVLLVAAIILTMALCTMFSVNAATDGELFEKITVIFNGEKVDPDTYIESTEMYEEDGKTVMKYDFDIPDDESSVSIEIVEDTDAESTIEIEDGQVSVIQRNK